MIENNNTSRDGIKIFSGTSNRILAQKIASLLNLQLGKCHIARFSDGEIMVEVGESVRNKDVYLVQSVCPPVNDHLMELVVMADAMYRASALRITAILPYLGYTRQDRRPRSVRVPITSKVVANMMSSAGIRRVLTVDLHAEQIQGFFNIPVDNVYASPIMLGDIWRNRKKHMAVVSPDIGGVLRARAVAKRLDGAELAIIDKRRPKPNKAEVMHIIGKVRDRHCVIVDDIVDTAGTLCAAAEVLKDKNASRVVAYCTHPILSGNALDNINNSALDELVVTNTIPLSQEAQKCGKIRVLSTADMLAESIRRICEGESLSSMFVE
ncbi:MAG: ribose-phosphate pyrophosphokinase [Candidatus Porifericomitaceae bacterium WSBS_2022_MAG_OTU9]